VSIDGNTITNEVGTIADLYPSKKASAKVINLTPVAEQELELAA
jgi:hypothetical protein